MNNVSSIVEFVGAIIMIVIGSIIFFQNYRYWRDYGGNPSVYWFTAGGSFAFLGCWVIISRYLLPEFFTLDSHTVDMLTLSRHILFPVILLYFVGVGFWEYVLNK
jgi:hypothetical protein